MRTARREGFVGDGRFCDYDRDGFLDLYLTTNMLGTTTNDGGRRGYLFHNPRQRDIPKRHR